MFTIFYILFWMLYFIAWLILFWINYIIFKRLSGIDIDYAIIETQNKGLWSIIKWQLIGQSIMIATIIYFVWVSFDKVFIDWVINFEAIGYTFYHIFVFWFYWIILFQTTLYILSKKIPLYKEIIVDENESLWKIVEWLLIAMSIIISIAVFSY